MSHLLEIPGAGRLPRSEEGTGCDGTRIRRRNVAHPQGCKLQLRLLSVGRPGIPRWNLKQSKKQLILFIGGRYYLILPPFDNSIMELVYPFFFSRFFTTRAAPRYFCVVGLKVNKLRGASVSVFVRSDS